MDNFFSKLSREDTYSMLGVLLYAASEDPRYSTLNELSYLLDNRSFVNLIKYYEGQTIKIPTLEETRTALRVLLLYQYYHIDNLSWYEALDKAGYNFSESFSARQVLQHFCKHLEANNYKLGGLKNVFKESKI